MAKKREKKEGAAGLDARILLGWVAREYYFRALPVASTLDEAWFESEVKRRIGKPDASPGGIEYFYTKATRQGARPRGHLLLVVLQRSVQGRAPHRARLQARICPARGHNVIFPLHSSSNYAEEQVELIPSRARIALASSGSRTG